VGKAESRVALSEQLKAVLACPVCKGQLEFHESRGELCCLRCRLVWPIRDDVPDLAPGSSRPLGP
jgi:uncharacterized protein